MKVIGFHTDDELYSEHAKLMTASLERFGLVPEIHVVSASEWQAAIAYKPEFIDKMCQKYPDDSILYIDVDAFVHVDVSKSFLDIEEDIAVHYHRGNELASGTLFINNTVNARGMISEWVTRMRKNPELWDQKVLEDLVDEWTNVQRIKINKLGPEYTYIYDLTPKRYKGRVGSPIIEHLQASREIRMEKDYNSASWYRKLWLTSILNKRYRGLLKRRKYTEVLGAGIDINVDIEKLRVLKN